MRILLVVIITVLCWSSHAGAQSVDDFRNAADQKGCGLIPYRNQRWTCDDRAPKIEDYCKRRTWSCDDLDPEGLKRKIEQVKTKIEKTKDEIRNLERELNELQSKKSNAKDDSERRDLESRISDRERELKDKREELQKFEGMVTGWENQIASEKREIGDRLSIGKQCREYRLDVQKAFAETKSYLERENSPEIKPHAERIIKKIVDEERGHQDEIDIVSRGISKCERMY